jgi:hypothetical protein
VTTFGSTEGPPKFHEQHTGRSFLVPIVLDVRPCRGHPKNTTCRKMVRNQKPTVWPESRTTMLADLSMFSRPSGTGVGFMSDRRSLILPIPKDCPFLTLECRQPHRHPTIQTLTNCQNVAGLWLKYGVRHANSRLRARAASQRKKMHDATIY